MLEKCLNTIINRHESLRTYFEIINDNVVQKIIDKADFKLDIIKNIDYENLDSIFKSFVKPFDLSKAPLFRTKFISFTNGKCAILVDMHHIIADGTSLSIIINELSKLYNQETLEEISITYKDFTLFEQKRLDSGELYESEKYWLSQFEDEIPVLNMPTNYSRPAVQTYKGKKINTSIDKNLTNKIKHICQELEVTPYMLLLSCYYILLSKYTSQDDIVIGSPIVGRDISEVYNIIGMFVNTLALRTRIDTNLSFKDFVYTIKNNVLESYKHQSYPFDELINKLNIKRDSSRNPLFDTMFSYQNNLFENLTFNNLDFEYYVPDTNISKFDLTLEAIPNNNRINLSFEYSTSLFDDLFIKELSEHYLNILNTVINNVSIKICDIGMLSENEKENVIRGFNNTSLDYPKDKSIPSIFEKQVRKTPNNIAVIFEDQSLTYKELNQKANSLAYLLKNTYKIKANEPVGIMVNRSLEMIVSILAVLKSGATYIPIDPTYPKDRIDYMLKSSNAKLLLTHKKTNEIINFKNKIPVDLDSNVYFLPNYDLDNTISPNDLAYIIFTSGSTGKPKGVMLKHKNIVNFAFGMNKEFNFTPKDTIASITTISFDIFVLESIVPLLFGSKIVIANENEQINSELFNTLCLKNGVNIFQTTPSRMQTFMSNSTSLDFIKKCKYILIGGESFPSSLLESLRKLTNSSIYNMYGPTETAVWSSLKLLSPSSQITIGKPIANTQFYILDNALNPLPYNVSGEIYISGDGVSNGYLNNKELTKKVFINNPFIKNTLMYKTGDLGKYTKDGEIICLGRSDQQIKIRGLRIELGEIDSLISKYPNIKKNTTVKQSINGREFIFSYFVATKEINISDLRNYLSKKLPRYMIPSYFVALEDLVYTPNGKIDKKSLPLPNEFLNNNEDSYVAPKTTLEISIAKIWEKLLNTQPIGINDNFFDLGGDSLLAMSLNMELLKITDKISYQDIFRYPTISELEEKINAKDDTPMFEKLENLSVKHLKVLENTRKIGNIIPIHSKGIILTGATGFLGIHILKEFIEKDNCNIYCIIRPKAGSDTNKKLLQKLNYYFGNKYDSLLDKRIFTYAGDISEPNFGLSKEDVISLSNKADAVINCAANVSHFGNYKTFYESNVKSVKLIIDYCKSFNKKLYHVSTMSVSGVKLDMSYMMFKKKLWFFRNNNQKINFNESNLYIGQELENVYIKSKFEAENILLNAIGDGLNGYILRMGNLMPRLSDGVFQENILENAFINRIISFIKLGFIPNDIVSSDLEFTPVDEAASAILKIFNNPTSINRIFHIYNHNTIKIKKFVNILKGYGFTINILPKEEFDKKITDMMHNNENQEILNNLLYDLDNNLQFNSNNDIIISSKFTQKYLRKIQFKWHKITHKYLDKFIKTLRKVI